MQHIIKCNHSGLHQKWQHHLAGLICMYLSALKSPKGFLMKIIPTPLGINGDDMQNHLHIYGTIFSATETLLKRIMF